jgi:hypothetical protein
VSDPGAPQHKIGDVANGYVLTESGWQPVPAGQPTQPSSQEYPAQTSSQEYKVGDEVNGYVLTESGWQPVSAGQPTEQSTQAYQVGDVVGGYVLTESGWVPVPGAQGVVGEPVPTAAPYGGGPVRTGRNNKVLYWVLGGAAALVLLVVIGVVIAVRGSDSGTTTSSSSSPQATRTTARSTPTEPTTASSAKAFAFGETGTVTTRGGQEAGELTIAAPVPFQAQNRYETPQRGQYVYVPITMTATGTDSLKVSSFDFVALLPDGQRVTSTFIVELPATAPARLSASDLNPGEKVTGSLGFDVPANTPLKIAWAPTSQILGTWG